MSEILLDTCACLWLLEGSLSASARDELQQRVSRGEMVWVSAVTAWEIAMLLARGRMVAPVRAADYFRRLLEPPWMRLVAAEPQYLIESNYLPGGPPRDPWDRILVATAREAGLALMTRDRALLQYAVAGHVQALAC